MEFPIGHLILHHNVRSPHLVDVIMVQCQCVVGRVLHRQSMVDPGLANEQVDAEFLFGI